MNEKENLGKVAIYILITALAIIVITFMYYDQLRARSTITPTATLRTNLYLKAGPGELFERLGLYKKWTSVSLLGKAPGDAWYSVKTNDGKTGWMSADYLNLSQAVNMLPTIEITNSLSIHGSVQSSDGIPGNEIMLMMDRTGSTSEQMMLLHTNSDGEFYAYVPPDNIGIWRISVSGHSCDSHLMDQECQLSQYFLKPIKHNIDLPHTGPVTFIYERATTSLKGIVQDPQSNPVNGAYVLGTRADGAGSGRRTDHKGAFELPAAAGQWDLRAQLENRKGETISVIITEGQSVNPVILVLP